MPDVNAKKRRRIGKERALVIVLLILLIISLSYITYSEYTGFITDRTEEALIAGYNQGLLDGVVSTVEKLYLETASCQPVPIYLENQTRYIIDVDCLYESV
jgi:hypothetical protein